MPKSQNKWSYHKILNWGRLENIILTIGSRLLQITSQESSTNRSIFSLDSEKFKQENSECSTSFTRLARSARFFDFFTRLARTCKTFCLQSFSSRFTSFYIMYHSAQKKHHPLFLVKLSLKSANYPSLPIFWQSPPPLYWFFVNPHLKIRFFSQSKKHLSFSSLTF